MVERRSELKRRYHRKTKMAKLKKKLNATKSDGDRSKLLLKIKALSPFWTEPSSAPAAPAAKAEKPARKAPAKKSS